MNAKQRKNENHLPDLVESLRLSPSEELGGHLSDEEFVGYLMVDEHLSTCQECAEEMRQMIEAAEKWRYSDLESKRLELREQIRKHVGHTGPIEKTESKPKVKLLSGTEAKLPAAPQAESVKPWQESVRPRLPGSQPDELLVAIDVGSSKVAVLIGHRNDKGDIFVVGRGLAPNRGTRKGNIVNVEATLEALKQAREEAEVMAGVEISRAYVGLSSPDIRSVNTRGMVSVTRHDREITQQDIQRVLEVARSTPLPADREVLHAVPQEFTVDEQGGIRDPLGMLGTRLEASVHLVTTNVARLRTLRTCINRAGIKAVEMVFEPLAAAQAILTPDERELGVLLVDVGAATTEYAYFADGEIQYSAVTPIGAAHFTNDLAMVLRTPFAEAERIKLKHGCCLSGLVTDEEGIAVPMVAGGASRVVPKRELCEILQPRAEELFHLIYGDLIKNIGDNSLRGGIVLTGGGAQLDGLLELVEQIFDAGVRYGLPRGIGGLVDIINSPSWATASGLLLHGAAAEEKRRQCKPARKGFSLGGVMGSLRDLLSDLL